MTFDLQFMNFKLFESWDVNKSSLKDLGSNGFNTHNKLNFKTRTYLNDKQLKQNLDEVIGHHNVVGVHVKDPQDKES